jgi:hypothetical protein
MTDGRELYKNGMETDRMTRLRGHFDGKSIVLDEPIPTLLPTNTVVEVVIRDSRELALTEFEKFSKEIWERPVPSSPSRTQRGWRREDLYDRGDGVIP